MNSLMSYGSDDNSDDSGDERFPDMPGHKSTSAATKNYRKPFTHEDNYEEVGMDMSEDSNDSAPKEPHVGHQMLTKSNEKDHNEDDYSLNHRRRKSGSRSPRPRREEENNRNKRRNEDRDGKEERSKGDDRYRRRDREERNNRNERSSRDEERSRREDDKGRDRYREDRRDRRDDRHGRDRRDRRRSKSRDRRRSRSPRKTSRSPRRSRSNSKDQGSRGYPSRREKADKRMDRLDKLGIEFKPDSYPASAIEEAERNSKTGGDRFFIPGITGRFRDQIEKRKLLWQKAKEPDNIPLKPSVSAAATATAANLAMAGGSKATKVYEATTFADDKTSNKFKRLMGIKETTDTSSLPVKSTDVLKKQQEMFSSMEAQYEVARTATHTMRGVGLGFGSFQR